jgi:hypothetical protein
MHILNSLKSWFERRLGQSLRSSLSSDCLVVDPDEEHQLVMKKMTLGVEKKRLWGFLPKFTLSEIGSVSFGSLVSSLVQVATDSLRNHIRTVPGVVRKLAATSFKETVVNRAARVKTTLAGTIAANVVPFNENSLKALIVADRNVFRRKLLEEIGKKTAETFGSIAAKRIGELVMRVRQEVEPTDAGSGSEASVALPKGTRFFVKKGKMTVFVIEEPPQTRTLKMMDEAGQKSVSYQLSFPHVVFFVVLRGRKSDKMHVLFRKKPLRSLEDTLQCPALPNIHEDFQVCFAPSASKDSLAVMAEESIGNFWGGRFLLTDAASNMRKQITLDAWVEGSKKDSLFGLSFDWRNTSVTVASMLKQITRDFGLEQEDTSSGTNNRGRKLMSALEQTIEKITASVENEMKETCFHLVPDWKVDETASAQLLANFRQVVGKISERMQESVSEEIDGLLKEEALQKALEDAVEQTIQSLEKEAGKPLAAAQESFIAQLKGGATS